MQNQYGRILSLICQHSCKLLHVYFLDLYMYKLPDQSYYWVLLDM